MTSKIIVNTIEADTGISSVTFASNINLQNDSSVLVSSSGIRLGTGSTIAAPSANEIALSTNSAERVRIDSAGNLLSGTSSSLRGGQLQVASSGAGTEIQITESSDAGGGPTLRITRLRGSNLSSPAPVQANNYMGQIAFDSYDTGAYRVGAFVRAEAEQTWASGDCPTRLIMGTTSDGANSPTTRLTIKADAKFGFNTINPPRDYCFHSGQADTNIQITNNTTGVDDSAGALIQQDGNDLYIWNKENSFMSLGTNAGERLRITSDGKVGINETSPNGSLHIGNLPTGSGNLNVVTLDRDDGTLIYGIDYNGSSNLVSFTGNNKHFAFANKSGAAETVRIDSSGRALIGSPNGSTSQLLQIKGDTGGSANGGTILLQNGVADSSAANGTGLGGIAFGGATGNQYCRIEGFADGSAGTNDYPGRLSFSTTADGASSPSERMRIDASGYVTKPNTPAFFVYKNQAVWALAAGDTFVFDTAELNVGSHYNTTNGRFTAPITARYVFHFWSIYTGDSQSDYVQMYKNGARIYGGDVHFTNSIGSQWDAVHYSRVIQLSSGDYVYMRSGSAHTYHGNHWGGWSGYMLG